MPRLSIDELKQIREKGRQTLTLRSGEARARVIVHLGTCGISAGAREVMGALLERIFREKAAASLFVKKHNPAAVALYRRLGFRELEDFRISYFGV